jgi:hypothetical protein
MFKSPDPAKGIVVGTGVMLLLALPRTIANWDDLASGAYSSLWFIWPMIGFGLVSMALAEWRTWGRRRAETTAAAAVAPAEGRHSGREGH